MRASAARAQVLIVTGSGSALQVAASVGSHIGVGCPLACSSACACGADAVQVPALALALCGASSAGPFLRGRFFEAEAFFLSYRLVLAPAARFFSSPNSGARCCPVYEPGVAKTLGECALALFVARRVTGVVFAARSGGAGESESAQTDDCDSDHQPDDLSHLHCTRPTV